VELAGIYSVSTCIQHKTAVTVSTSDDINRHSSNFRIATILEEKKCVLSFVLYGQICLEAPVGTLFMNILTTR
jgi:hypothetical protein